MSSIEPTTQNQRVALAQPSPMSFPESAKMAQNTVTDVAPPPTSPSKEVPAQLTQTDLEQMNRVMQTNERGVQFQFNDDLDMTIVQIVDDKTGELIRQIPNQELVKLKSHINDVIGGLLNTLV